MTGGPSITGLPAAAGHRPGGVRTISTERDLAAAAACYDAHFWVHANRHVVLSAHRSPRSAVLIGHRP